MNQEQLLSDVYKDFFGDYEKRKQEQKEVIDVNFEEEINKLYLSEESKELLKKIISYIENYTSDKRYIPFNISLLSLTNKTTKRVVDLLKGAIAKSNYLK